MIALAAPTTIGPKLQAHTHPGSHRPSCAPVCHVQDGASISELAWTGPSTLPADPTHITCRLKGSLQHLASTAREIDPRGRAHVANATRYFSYPSNFTVSNPVSPMTNSP